jgi:hypothetical protein
MTKKFNLVIGGKLHPINSEDLDGARVLAFKIADELDKEKGVGPKYGKTKS